MNSASPAPTYDLLGVQMSILNMPETVRRIQEAVAAGHKGYICVTGMHGIMEARDDSKLQNILNRAFLCTPDGMPTVWFGKAKGFKQMDRVYGPDLMLAVMENTRNQPVRHFFYGGAEGVAADLKTRMESRFPGLHVSGTYCPPFRPLNKDEREELKGLVEESKADILWVGLSTPKQEHFMAEFLPSLPVKVMIGVGAAFDFHTARAKQAPRWMQRSGLEWFFRLITEPKRLGRRYLTQVPRFAVLLGLDRFGLISHSSETPEMPPAFRVMSHWPTIALVSASVWILSSLTAGFVISPKMAFEFAAWLIIPLSLLLLSAILMHASSDEERLDRAGPVIALLLKIYMAGVAIAGPLLALVAGCIRSPESSIGLARWCALFASIPFAVIAMCVSGCIIAFTVSRLRRHQE